MSLVIPQLLIVAGTGRNSGKTTLVCDIIRSHCRHHRLAAIKVSPHFHDMIPGWEVLAEREDLFLMEETNRETGKDSSRMLSAGAWKVFYAMATDETVPEVLDRVLRRLPEGTALICESGGLRKYVQPGLFLVLHHKNQARVKPEAENLKLMADRWITFDGEGIDIDPETIYFTGKTWKIKPNI